MKKHIWYVIAGKQTMHYGINGDRFFIEVITINPQDEDRKFLFHGRRCSTIYLDASLEAADKDFVNEFIKPCCCVGEKEIIII